MGLPDNTQRAGARLLAGRIAGILAGDLSRAPIGRNGVQSAAWYMSCSLYCCDEPPMLVPLLRCVLLVGATRSKTRWPSKLATNDTASQRESNL